MKEPINKVDRNTVSSVRTNSQCRGEVVAHVQQKSPWLYPYFYPCTFRFGHLLLLLLFLFDFYITFYNYKKPITVNRLTSLQMENTSIIEINMNWKFLLIYNPYIFMELKRPLNWLKRWNNKDRRKLKRNCKTLFKVKCIQISCKKCQTLDLSAIEG